MIHPIKLLLGPPAALRVPTSLYSKLISCYCVSRRAVDTGPSAWVTVTHMAKLDGVPGLQLQPGLALVVMAVRGRTIEWKILLSLSLSLFFKYTNKFLKIKKWIFPSQVFTLSTKTDFSSLYKILGMEVSLGQIQLNLSAEFEQRKYPICKLGASYANLLKKVF